MKSQLQARRVSAIWQQGMARRRFLKWGLLGSAGVAAVAAGGFALLRRSPLDKQAVPAWAQGLSEAEYHLFNRARQVLLPVDGTALLPSEQVPVVKNVQTLLGHLHPLTRKEVAAGLGLFDNAAVLTQGSRFVDLSDEDARDYFDSWGQGNVIQRTLATVIKQLVYSAYWQDSATWPPTEFDGPVSDKWGLAYLGNAPLPDSVADGEARA
ncbi:MAG: hypothetical protein ACFE0K_02075 [Alcanivorax sp.]|uniref:hypothetical protein n=1 Tax=Alcanivorax sp. TaxID=1872427 RepID=UPI003DA6EC30